MFFSKLAAPGDARKHNQSYQTPRLLFLFSDYHGTESLLPALCLSTFTRLRLVSGGRHPKILVHTMRVLGDTLVNHWFCGRQFKFVRYSIPGKKFRLLNLVLRLIHSTGR